MNKAITSALAPRIHYIRERPQMKGPVLYWMSREQRVQDNWGLIHAQQFALQREEALSVVFCLVPHFLEATLRQYQFLLAGLEQVQQKLADRNISFQLVLGDPVKILPRYIEEQKIGMIVTDFDPLRVKRYWQQTVGQRIKIPLAVVDSHNVVPCRTASVKQEYGAYTLRPKIKRLLPEYLRSFPRLQRQASSRTCPSKWRVKNVLPKLTIDRSVEPVADIASGEDAARKQLKLFLAKKLNSYAQNRNDPNLDGTSGLSPYLHYGQLSAQRVALEVMAADAPENEKESFLEELIVRREIADNFCFYQKNYDSFAGFPDWAKKNLTEHKTDRRAYTYTRKQFETSRTHDPLWNAAQKEMVKRGRMHGYLRMYWAKKILEWSPTCAHAQKWAIYLNDKYQLDGRDPNGYTGIAWSIGGVHDRAWPQREVYGKIRSMTLKGCQKKFDVDQYINKVEAYDD